MKIEFVRRENMLKQKGTIEILCKLWRKTANPLMSILFLNKDIQNVSITIAMAI
jgi:hypothetical protein